MDALGGGRARRDRPHHAALDAGGAPVRRGPLPRAIGGQARDRNTGGARRRRLDTAAARPRARPGGGARDLADLWRGGRPGMRGDAPGQAAGRPAGRNLVGPRLQRHPSRPLAQLQRVLPQSS